MYGAHSAGPIGKSAKETAVASTQASTSEEEPGAAAGADDLDVHLVGVSKHYGEVVAVHGLDLEVKRGEFFTLLGPSGSGKTTTLRMIAGFEEPDTGRVELGGKDVTGLPPYDRSVNTVFQDYALFPHMTVGENVAYGLRVKGVGKEERRKRATEALATVRLGGYEGRKPNQLSGGQQQRVALARAIINEPRVLLLDEPLGALDLKLREQMQVELKTIQGQVGITFIYVTHDQEEALTMSDRIAVFNEGRIEQIGPPTEIYERPAERLRRRLRRRLEPARARWPALHGAPGEDLVHRERCGARRTSHRGGDDQGRLLRRNDHPISRRPRVGGTAPNRPPEPGDDLRGGPGRTRPQSENWMASGSDRRRRGRGGRKVSKFKARSAWLPAAIVGGLAATMLVVAGCGGSSSSSSDNGTAQKSVGAGEGQLNLVAWPGYVADPWKSDFEKQTGCQIKLKEAGTSDEMVDLMRTGQWDGVSASGNATAKLVDGGDVAPGEHRPGARTTRRSSTTSRTSRTTRSTGSITGSRTDVGRTS